MATIRLQDDVMPSVLLGEAATPLVQRPVGDGLAPGSLPRIIGWAAEATSASAA